MQKTHSRIALLGLLAVFMLGVLTPALAIEDGIFGVRIGASYREITQKFGPPHGIVFSSMVFQTVAPTPGSGLPVFGQAQTGETPIWVMPVRPGSMNANASEWVYDFRKTRGLSLGIVLSGQGADAMVTDVIVASYPQYLKGKAAPVRTAKGIQFQDTFEEVLKKYGYPPLIEIYGASGSVVTGAAAGGLGNTMQTGGRGGNAMRAGGGGRGMMGGGRGGMSGGMGGGRGGMMGGRGGQGGQGGMGSGRRGMMGASLPNNTTMTEKSSYTISLTGSPGSMQGGRRGGMGGQGGRGGAADGNMGGGRGMMGGGMGGRSGGARGRTGTIAPLGSSPTASVTADQFSATATVNGQGISFSRDCTMVYEGIAFSLHDFKVYRIHVSE